MIIHVDPMGAPRQTQRDRWAKRPVVLRYHAYKDTIREHTAHLVEACSLSMVFEIQPPKSWSQKKTAQMIGKPHQQKPDIDNLVKAVLDSMHQEDKHIHTVTARKVWGSVGRVTIEAIGTT